MTNTNHPQPNLYDRAELGAPSTGVQVRSRGRLVAYTGIAIGLLAALVYAAVDAVGDWSQLVVAGGIILASAGVMIAIDPARRSG